MKFKKLLVCHLDKTYSINIVSKQCFNISPKIESVGFFDAFKIFDDNDLNFRIKELIRLNYTQELKGGVI